MRPAYADDRLLRDANSYRLPTDVQWEYACRAGTTTRYWSGDSEADLARVGWYRKNSGNRTHAVGEKPANPWGLHDMHGNVWEWCHDWHARVLPSTPQADPTGPEEGRDRVFRGGSSANRAGGARSGFRGRSFPGVRVLGLGFRVVRPAPQRGPGV